MTDTGPGFYIGMFFGGLSLLTLIIFAIRFIIYGIKFLLTPKTKQ
jgi:hypothetical protein